MDLYQKRLAAGSGWYENKDNNLHTVQLMVLTADQAEANLKRRFADQAYRDIADDLYIIKDNGSKVFVYYGQYPDLDAARQARNTMPIFLRKHNPRKHEDVFYPLSRPHGAQQVPQFRSPYLPVWGIGGRINVFH